MAAAAAADSPFSGGGRRVGSRCDRSPSRPVRSSSTSTIGGATLWWWWRGVRWSSCGGVAPAVGSPRGTSCAWRTWRCARCAIAGRTPRCSLRSLSGDRFPDPVRFGRSPDGGARTDSFCRGRGLSMRTHDRSRPKGGEMNSRIQQVTSRDGTSIAFERIGEGPPVILVMGAFNDRSTGAPLAAALSPRLRVYTYDRRGRGDSGDTLPYAVEREVEDLHALIDEAGGSAAVFGYSSGAVLAARAASQGLPITRLILHELPLMVDQGQPRWSADHQVRLRELVATGRRGDAVEYFQLHLVGIPDEVVAQLRRGPFPHAIELRARPPPPPGARLRGR